MAAPLHLMGGALKQTLFWSCRGEGKPGLREAGGGGESGRSALPADEIP
jgi:hypothetical protein